MTHPSAPSAPDFDVLIVGTGFSGLGMAIRLLQEGRRSFVILERAGDVGGTWRDNRYPGCACDVPSHLYSFSFEPNPRWSRMFAPQAEILAYLRHCADKYRLRPHIRFNAEVVRADFDEPAGTWRVQTQRGDVLTARHLVFGVGALSRPAYPQIPGLSRFAGKAFHSAAWDDGYDLRGRRVAVIGTGASAVQFVPQIAPRVAHLDLYQRTPPWILPKPDRAVTAREQRLFARLPTLQRLYRYGIYWFMELRGFGFTVNPKILELAAGLCKRHIRRQIADPALRDKVTPAYTPGCKRILISGDYYPALGRPNVDLVTDAITEITPTGVVTRDAAGQRTERPADALIYGTGFRVSDMLTPVRVTGRGGRDLNTAWQGGIEAYLGTTVAGFPNLFLLMGPNTGLGHSSMIFMIEAQIDYALGCMRAVEASGARALDVRPGAQAAFNRALQPRLRRAVWASGCKSWYLDEAGRNATLWPGFTFEFWARTRRVDRADYALLPQADPDTDEFA